MMGGVGYVSSSLAYLTALTLAPASLVALLLYMYPGLVTVLAVLILRERLSAVRVGAFAGLGRVGPSTAATLSTVEPVVTVLLATLFLHEALRPIQVLGGLCILVAVVALARQDTQPVARPSRTGRR